jgi:hypothetical protein
MCQYAFMLWQRNNLTVYKDELIDEMSVLVSHWLQCDSEANRFVHIFCSWFSVIKWTKKQSGRTRAWILSVLLVYRVRFIPDLCRIISSMSGVLHMKSAWDDGNPITSPARPEDSRDATSRHFMSYIRKTMAQPSSLLCSYYLWGEVSK